MFSGFAVLFDSSVFYSASVRDLFIELAATDIYRAKWTEQIHEEWIENLLRKRPDLKRPILKKQKNSSMRVPRIALLKTTRILLTI